MLEKYLECTQYVDFDDTAVRELAVEIKSKSDDELSLIENTYLFVRDEIHHSWDENNRRVTVTASDVLREGTGICWAKANLFAALLRANGIPTGFSYQRLRIGDTPDNKYGIHALNTVFITSLDKWIRLDARGNKEGINAEFSLNDEKLAYKADLEGEKDYHNNCATPDEKLMKALENSDDVIDMCLHHMPDRLNDENEMEKLTDKTEKY